MAAHPRFLTDENGQRIAVVLDIAEYEKMVEELEDMDDIRVCNERLASGEKAIPLEQAIEEIERSRR
ncbi:MAG: hypothetical protein ACRD5W_04755 [Candidatus Acidiferrales bacterium]